MFTSDPIIFFNNSEEISWAILLMFDPDIFFRFIISFSAENNSFSISSLIFFLLISISLSNLILALSINFVASFFEFSII